MLNESSQHQTSSALSLIVREMFEGEYAEIKEIIHNDPVEIEIASEDEKILPPQFLDLARKLHHNYLYWKHLRDRQQTTQPTFYRYTQEGITKAKEKVAAETPIEPEILLLLETRIALITINSLLLAAEDYLRENHLQDAKESVDTALSTLYEFIKTREKLESSLKATIASIQQDIANEPESNQYASYLATQIVRLQNSSSVKEPKLYVVRNQLEKLGETLILLIPGESSTSPSQPKSKQDIDAVMTRLLFAMVDDEAYITAIAHKGSVNSVAFSPDGNYLATASDDCTAKLVEVETGRVVKTIRHESGVNSVTFSPKGVYLRTLMTRSSKTIKLVKVETGKEITTLKSVGDVSFSPQGDYLIARTSNMFKLLKAATGKEITTIEYVWDVSFSPKGTYFAAKTYNAVKLVESKSGREVISIGHESKVVFSPKETSFAAIMSKTIKLVEVKTGKEIRTIEEQFPVNDAAFSPDGNYLAIRAYNTVKVVEVETGRKVTTIRDSYQIDDVVFSPNSTHLVTRVSTRGKLVEVATGREVAALEYRVNTKKVLFSSDGNYLLVEAPEVYQLLEVKTGREVIELPSRFIHFSPDSKYLVATSRTSATLIEVAKGRKVTRISYKEIKFPISEESWSSVCFSPDENYLVVGASKIATLVEVATGKEIAAITHGYSINAVAFSPDSTYFATASTNGIARLVDLELLFQIVSEAENYSEPPPPPPISSIVHVEKPEAFFLGWLRIESNRYSFYEYMLAQAEQEKEGLSVRYHSPILETNLLLESLGFLLLNAEKHYQRVYPTLISINDNEISLIAMQDMKQSIAAGLSSLHEFLYHRMELDGEDYSKAIERFKQEVEEKVENSELLFNIHNKLQSILQLEGVQNRGELQTNKEMLEEIGNILQQLLPEKLISNNLEDPVIPIKKYMGKEYILDAIKGSDLEYRDLTVLLSKLRMLGLLTPDSAAALLDKVPSHRVLEFYKLIPEEIIHRVIISTAISKVESQEIIELCKLLPKWSINENVALQLLNKQRKTHYYLGLISTFIGIDISKKETLLERLESASRTSQERR
ncbi:WD40 repeat domain-containing protein [Lusitaniella coriacea]|uniref:WD40 repeat domain-containing protein n=1 Tax=Lusitaniella coriacea TaxID=1983105 RepID=UPI003CFA8E31